MRFHIKNRTVHNFYVNNSILKMWKCCKIILPSVEHRTLIAKHWTHRCQKASTIFIHERSRQTERKRDKMIWNWKHVCFCIKMWNQRFKHMQFLITFHIHFIFIDIFIENCYLKCCLTHIILLLNKKKLKKETTTMERNMKLFQISGFCVNQSDQQKNE